MYLYTLYIQGTIFFYTHQIVHCVHIVCLQRRIRITATMPPLHLSQQIMNAEKKGCAWRLRGAKFLYIFNQGVYSCVRACTPYTFINHLWLVLETFPEEARHILILFCCIYVTAQSVPICLTI